MKKQEIINLFQDEGIDVTEDQLQGLGDAIDNLMTDLAMELEQSEPHAVVSIRALREARGTVRGMIEEAD